MSDYDLAAVREYCLSQNGVFLPDIEEGVAGQVIADLARRALEKPKFIPLVICSAGGLTDAGFAIAQFIEFRLTVPVHAEVFGICNSAATYPLLCCERRVANELVTFVIHRQTSTITLGHSADFKKNVDGWEADNAALHTKQVRFYSRKLGISTEVAEQLIDRGSSVTSNELSAQEALKLGLLTKVRKLKKAAGIK